MPCSVDNFMDVIVISFEDIPSMVQHASFEEVILIGIISLPLVLPFPSVFKIRHGNVVGWLHKHTEQMRKSVDKFSPLCASFLPCKSFQVKIQNIRMCKLYRKSTG